MKTFKNASAFLLSRFVLLCGITLFAVQGSAQKKNSVLIESINDYYGKLEVGMGAGISCFVGTMNFYSKDFLGLYRMDGNNVGLSVGLTIDRRFSPIFSYGLLVNYSVLNGLVTYGGEPTIPMEIMAQMKRGTQGTYSTSIFIGMPTFSCDLLALYSKIMCFENLSRSRIKCTVGIGYSNTMVEKTPFLASNIYPDVQSFNTTEYAILLALRYQYILSERLSLYCDTDYFMVNNPSLDGYFMNSQMEFEGIPSKNADGLPSTLDTFLSVHIGVIVRLRNRT